MRIGYTLISFSELRFFKPYFSYNTSKDLAPAGGEIERELGRG
jgi:hypothetical protein